MLPLRLRLSSPLHHYPVRIAYTVFKLIPLLNVYLPSLSPRHHLIHILILDQVRIILHCRRLLLLFAFTLLFDLWLVDLGLDSKVPGFLKNAHIVNATLWCRLHEHEVGR